MKIHSSSTFRAGIPIFAAACFVSAAADKPDAFEASMRQAFADYKKGDFEAVSTELRELLRLMEEKNAGKVGQILPEVLEKWEGESLRRDDLAAVGGGVCLSRLYKLGERRITVKVIKDSPLAKQLLLLIGNEDLLRMSNRKIHRISGETAVMEGDSKLQMAVDGRIYVEAAGGEGTGEKDLVAFARKLDLDSLAKMK